MEVAPFFLPIYCISGFSVRTKTVIFATVFPGRHITQRTKATGLHIHLTQIRTMPFKRLWLYILLLITLPTCKSSKNTLDEAPENQRVWGIDLSHYQVVYDWQKLAEQKPGFVFLKATEGVTIKDSKYDEYYRKLRELKIPVGSYHFFSYKSKGVDQAANFLKNADYRKGDLPLVLDAEYAKKMPDKATVVKDLQEFLIAVYNKAGVVPIIYCNYRYYLQYLKGQMPHQYHYWIVDYQGRPNCEWTFWQSTERYKLNGIRGYVDFNQFKGTRRELEAMLK